MTLAVGDIVRIARQPRNLTAWVEGQVGWIDALRDNWALVKTMHVDGRLRGQGDVPLDCLEAEPEEQWKLLKERNDREAATRLVEYQERSARWDQHVEAVAQKYGISSTEVLAIHKELKDWLKTARPFR